MTLRDIGPRLAYGMDQRASFAPPTTTAPAHSLGGGDAVTTDTRIDPATTEARCRRLMAEHAAIEARGWTSQRARDDLREMIDAELDAWLEAMS